MSKNNSPRTIDAIINRTEFKNTLLAIVGEDKVLKALVDTILIALGLPFASILTSGITGVMSYLQQDRTKVWFEELAKNHKTLDEKLLNSPEFVHKFVITYKAVLTIYQHEKIKLFSNLFIKGLDESLTDKILSVDEFEEMVKILEELTEIEIYMLTTLDHYESRIDGYIYKSPYEKNDLATFWEEFLVKVTEKVPEEDILPRLNRLQRTGLYQKFGPIMLDDMENVTPVSGNADGYLTSLYYGLKKFVLFGN